MSIIPAKPLAAAVLATANKHALISITTAVILTIFTPTVIEDDLQI
jgi:hypothetical protein